MRPHHVPKEWIARWKGKFDQGWDRMREETLARQIKMGIVPPGTKLAPKPPAIRDWDTLSADEKRLFTRQAEVFAAYAEYTDHEIGRMLKAFDDVGQADNTLVVYIAGDNGTSGEGGANGMFNEYTYFNGVQETVAQMLPKIDQWGGPETYPHMASGWAVGFELALRLDEAGAVRLRRHAQRHGHVLAEGHQGEERDPHAVQSRDRRGADHPGGDRPAGAEGGQQHAADPDGRDEPRLHVRGPKAKERHTTQYFEIAGNRAIYHDGWFARTIHRAPWEAKPRRTLEDNSAWQLYDTRSDFSLANDLASKNPQKLAELQAVFLQEAEKHHVLPMDDRVFERMDGAAVGRPDLMAGRTSMTLAEGMTGMMEGVFINVKNRSKTITAELDVPQGVANGTIIAQGGRFGGWSLYVKDGVPAYGYNFLGMQQSSIVASKPLAPGKSTVKFDFAYDGGGPGKGGLGTLFINGEKVGEGRIEHTQAGIFSADETADVGIDLGTPVVEAIGSEAKSKFNGHIPQGDGRGEEMNGIGRIIAAMALLVVGVQAVAQAPATPAPASKPISTSLGMVVFPAKGQTPEKQAQDEGECYAWSKGQTGVDPMAPPPAAAQPAAQTAHEGSCRRWFALEGRCARCCRGRRHRRSGGRRCRQGCGDRRHGGRCGRWPPEPQEPTGGR